MMISRQQVHSAVQAYMQEAAGLSPGKTGQTGTDPSAGVQRGDAVQLTGGAGAVSQWKQVLSQLPDVRPGVVSDLQSRIAAGTYPPPASDVARQMLSRWIGDNAQTQP
jgi:flagellar biosynthesis anti-sigma factor FlgM